jgi:D-sedoheptulose 7-phosphate isomerase
VNPFDQTIVLLRSIEATAADGQLVDCAQALRSVADLFVERASAGACFLFVGNGASQSIASHIAADFLKNGGAKAMAFTDPSLLTCVGNDLGFDRLFAEPILRFGEPGDVLVAISSSGRSANIIAAVEAARERDMTVVTATGFDADNPVRCSGDHNFWVSSHDYGDVEVVHGAICHRILDYAMARGD